jgi:hypothetical protein
MSRPNRDASEKLRKIAAWKPLYAAKVDEQLRDPRALESTD